jgi:hypothetical protein
MSSSEKTSLGRRKFFGALALGAAGVVAAVSNPFSLFKRMNGGTSGAHAVVTITPNPMAVQRTKQGAAHHG